MSRPKSKGAGDETADLRVGADIDDDDGVLVKRLGDGALLAPRAVRNATVPQQRCLAQLQSTVNALEHGHRQLDRLVAEARERGLSWDTIGWCCGITGEAVRKRFSDE